MDKTKIEAIWSSDPKLYVEWWLKTNKYVPGKAGIITDGLNALRYDQLKTKIFVDYHIDYMAIAREVAKGNKDLVTAKKTAAPPYKKKDLLHAAVDLILMEADKNRLNAVRMKIKFNPQADSEHKMARRFIENITTVRVPLGIAVILHFIWQVKRKMFGKEVEHHLVPVLRGAGGLGKSKNVDRFLEPVKDYLLPLTSASQLTDERSFHSFGENYVATLDEFSKMDKQDFNMIKNFITAIYLSSRTLYTNTVTSNPQNMSIFGTSNYPINELIFESAGMRRFYEYIIDKSIDKEVSMSIDYLAMWCSVDENGPSPILPYLDELTEYQDSIRTPDPMEEFFAEFNIDPSKPLTCRIECREGMYKQFKTWAEATGFDYPWMKREQNIRTKLLNRGLVQRKVNGKLFWYVNEDCKLNPLYKHVFIPSIISKDDLEEIESIAELERLKTEAVKKEDFVRAERVKRRIDQIKGKYNGIEGLLDI